MNVNLSRETLDLISYVPKLGGIISPILAIHDLGYSIQEKLFNKKLYTFLYSLKEKDFEERVKFLSNYVNGDEERFFERVISVLSSADSRDKAYYVSQAFHGFLYEKITQKEFFKLLKVIDETLLEDLEEFLKIKNFPESYTNEELGEKKEMMLEFILSKNDIFYYEAGYGNMRWNNSCKKYLLTDFGKKVYETLNN
ncbi:hypothetical protein [Psychrilyobacter atlanticus]|uniref:hypothetical protein n=1 Tax=Psychrilyobacter atlanticus TaxID=271091 RepID=UPI00041EAA27|nr:hypothetical protein [Psychrilyobacter atlanticus]